MCSASLWLIFWLKNTRFIRYQSSTSSKTMPFDSFLTFTFRNHLVFMGVPAKYTQIYQDGLDVELSM
jgi:hypothetical protein